MGLDMYLNGNAYFHGLTDEQLKTQAIEHRFRLGYWRKHPDLHGYIVEQFADGVDNCQPIELSAEGIHSIIEAIRNNKLPHTVGFFFGESSDDAEQKAESIQIFKEALVWLETIDGRTWRDITYQASW